MTRLFSRSRWRLDRGRRRRDWRKYFLPLLFLLVSASCLVAYQLFNLPTEIEEPATEIAELVPEEEPEIGEPTPPPEDEPEIEEPTPPPEEEPGPLEEEPAPPDEGIVIKPVGIDLIDSVAHTTAGGRAGHWGVVASGEDPNKYYIDFGNLVISWNQTIYVGNCSNEVFTLQNNSSTQSTLTIDGISGSDDLVYTFMCCVYGGAVTTLWTIDNDANTTNGSGIIPSGKSATVYIIVKTSGATPSTSAFAPGEWTIRATAP